MPAYPVDTVSGAMDEIRLVSLSLARSKRRGLAWRQAWRAAAASLPPVSTPDEQMERAALSATRRAWRRAYLDLPPARGELAAASLIDALREHEPTTADVLLLA